MSNKGSWIYLVFIVVILMSCNRSFFVRNDKVVREATGYLLYRGNECLFFKDDNLEGFFKKIKRDNGYRIYQGCGLESMKLIATKYVVENKYVDQGKEISSVDTIRVVPAYIRYISLNLKISEEVKIAFEHSNKLYEFKVWDLFNGEVLSINQVLVK